MTEQTYSITKNGIEKTWRVSDLIEINGEIIQWEIPHSFMESWTWGEDHISDHLYGCLKVDLSRPILIADGKIVDGNHRVCKALALGYRYIKAIDLTGKMPPPHESQPMEISDYTSKWNFGDVVACLKSLFRAGL